MLSKWHGVMFYTAVTIVYENTQIKCYQLAVVVQSLYCNNYYNNYKGILCLFFLPKDYTCVVMVGQA